MERPKGITYKSPYKGTYSGEFGIRMSEAYFRVSDNVAMDLAVTAEIPEDRLRDYLKAASATGFKVTKIAEEGEEYPVRGPEYQPTTRSMVVKKGLIAVCIEKPRRRSLYERRYSSVNPFWENLRSLDQNKV